MNKKKRLTAIKNLIAKFIVEDQDQLVELLKSNHSISTNQSIVSRDLRHLGIGKTIRDGVACYELPKIDATQEILKRAILDIQHNESMIVITTLPGLADFVGDFLDDQESDMLLGTLAGENILMAIPRSVKQISQIYKKVCTLVHFKKL
jgi:transcriptional regulator of arginine metabolism